MLVSMNICFNFFLPQMATMTYRQSSNLGVSYYRALKPIVDKKYDKSSFFFSSSSPRWNYTYKVRAGVQIERPGALRLVATFYQQQGFF